MIRLGISRETAWRDIAPGVRFLMRPATSIEIAAARAAATETVKACGASIDRLAEIGIDVPGSRELLDNPHFAAGLSRWLLAGELGAFLVEQWEGVADADGGPALLTPGNIREAMRYDIVQTGFEVAALGFLAAVTDEGKRQPPPRNGPAAGAANTAPGAGLAAPAASATDPVPST